MIYSLSNIQEKKIEFFFPRIKIVTMIQQGKQELDDETKEQLVQHSLLALTDFENIKYITKYGNDLYSNEGINMFQYKIYKHILKILEVEKLLSNDILQKYKLDGYLSARQIFNVNECRLKKYDNSTYYYTDKEIVLKTLFKYNKSAYFTYHLNANKYTLLVGMTLGVGMLAHRMSRL